MLSIVPRPSVQLKRRSEVTKHQENILTILQHSTATPLRCRGRRGYACSFCPSEHPEPADLKTHTLTSHKEDYQNFMRGHSLATFNVKLDITNLTCTICETTIPSLPDLKMHLISHGKEIHTIKDQIVPFIFEGDSLKCAICDIEYNNFKVLLEHMSRHVTNYVCKICGAGYVNKRTLQTHSYRHKVGEFKCEQCEKVFDTRVKMKEHVRAVHVCRKRSKCAFCGERFSAHAAARAHEASAHGARAHEARCRACDRRFGSQRALAAHTATYHLLRKAKNNT